MDITLEQFLEIISQLEEGVSILGNSEILDSIPEDISIEDKISILLKQNKRLNQAWQLKKNYSAH